VKRGENVKKKILLFGLIGIVPFMTGCGNSNTMKCTSEEDGFISGFIYTFDKEDKLEKISLTETVDFSKVDFSNLNCSSVDDCLKNKDKFLNNCSSNKNYENCKIDANKKSMTLTADYTEEKLSKDNTYKKGMTKDEVKKERESSSKFTCK
jgi:hypothetical protein